MDTPITLTSMERINKFLEKHKSPRFQRKWKTYVNKEIKLAIKRLASKSLLKSPGTDGPATIFYRMFLRIYPHLLRTLPKKYKKRNLPTHSTRVALS